VTCGEMCAWSLLTLDVTGSRLVQVGSAKVSKPVYLGTKILVFLLVLVSSVSVSVSNLFPTSSRRPQFRRSRYRHVGLASFPLRSVGAI